MTLEAVQLEMIEKSKGVGLVVADGGQAIEKGDEVYQEEAFAQLILCQVLVALSILEKGVIINFNHRRRDVCVKDCVYEDAVYA